MIMDIFALKKPRKVASESKPPLNQSGEYSGREDEADFTLVPEELFRKVLSLERKRSERSRHRFVLMLVHASKLFQGEQGKTVLEGITRALATSKRETDLQGWYHSGLGDGCHLHRNWFGEHDLHTRCPALQSLLRFAKRSRPRTDE